MEGTTSTASYTCCSTLHQWVFASSWGEGKDRKAVSALHLYQPHLYQPDAGQWVKITDMPTQRDTCACIMTADQELLAVGGYHIHHVDQSRLANMDIAQFSV